MLDVHDEVVEVDDADIMLAHSYDIIVGWLHEEVDDDMVMELDHEFVDDENEDEVIAEADKLLLLVEVDEDEVGM